MIEFASQAEAGAGGVESENVKLVDDMCKMWIDQDMDLDEVLAFFAEDCRLNLVEGQPPAVGKAAAGVLLNGFHGPGVSYDVKTLQTFASGPVVANSRIDTKLVDGRPVEKIRFAGVFIVKEGKIKEWSEYLLPNV